MMTMGWWGTFRFRTAPANLERSLQSIGKIVSKHDDANSWIWRKQFCSRHKWCFWDFVTCTSFVEVFAAAAGAFFLSKKCVF